MEKSDITWSYGIKDLEWKCPICKTKIRDLIHTRKNGVTYNGIQEHHYGKNPKKDYLDYLNSEKVLICYKCNIKEKKWRKLAKKEEALNINEMKTFFKQGEENDTKQT